MPPFKRLLCLFLSFLFVIPFIAQIKKDSLFLVFSDKSKPDSVRLNCMDDLSNAWLFRNPDTAIFLTKQGLKLATEKKLIKWEGIFLNTEGLAWYVKSDPMHALEKLFMSLEKWKEAGNKKGLARCYGNIGLIYQNQSELDKALQYQQQALVAFREAGDKRGIGNTLGNIGNIYSTKNDTLKAIASHKEALKMFVEIDHARGIATSHLNLADLFYQLGKWDSSIFHAEQARPVFEKNKNKKGLSAIFAIKGKIFNHNKNYKEAIRVCSEGLALAKEIHSHEEIKNACNCLSVAYEETGNTALALKHYKEYNDARDSLKDQETAQAVTRTEQRFLFGRKMMQDSLLHAQENKMQELKITGERKQKKYLWIILGCAVLFSVVMVNRVLVTRRQKRTIQIQKEMVDEKNKEITDSIRYAERIQKAVMPTEETFMKFFPESFVLFRPKDIVSGDFFWLHHTKDFIFYATADCTGHGVPGGFMSMLGGSLLDEVIGDMSTHEPADALDLLRIKIISALKQSSRAGENKDGMDMVLCRIKKDFSELTYAGAYNPLWIISEGELKEYPADKQPVGFFDESPKQFTQHRIALKKGDVIYTFTDGFADQFGGPKGKKFKYRKFLDLVKEMNQNKFPLQQQKAKLTSAFEDWKNNLEQVDDVCVIGVRV
jgi:serine phosphatase RsbU (regulator of sigma subunit)